MVTLVVAITLMYAYNAVAVSDDIKELSARAELIGSMALIVTIGVVVVMGWLVYYISNFILQKRSQEFGMYLLLGMNRKQVTRMFIVEQICMGVVAFIIGCFLGTFVFQIMHAIIVNSFSIQYQFSFQFSWKAFGLTFLCFLMIYVIELIRESRFLRKKKVYELLYSEKQNEKAKHKKVFTVLYFFLAIVSMLVGLKFFEGYMVSVTNGMDNELFLPSIILLVASVYFFFLGFSTVLSNVINHQKRVKYHGNTMYLFSQIAGRLRSNRIVLATLTLLTVLTLLFVTLGLKLNESSRISNELYTPYDIQAIGNQPLQTDAITSYLNQQQISYQSHNYRMYTLEQDPSTLMEAFKETSNYFPEVTTPYMKYSDYQALCKLKGMKANTLKDDEYIVVTSVMGEVITEYATSHPIGNLNLKLVETQEIGQSDAYSVYIIVVPDNFLEQGNVESYHYALTSESPSESAWRDGMQEQFFEDNSEESYDLNGQIISNESNIRIKAVWTEENLFSSFLINFCLIYLAIIFVCISATILAIQQLSDAIKQRSSYELLWKMGLTKKEIYGLMRKQIAVYFIIPVLLATGYVVPLIHLLDILFDGVPANESMFQFLGISYAFFMIIYLCYYLLAYFGCKRSIDDI